MKKIKITDTTIRDLQQAIWQPQIDIKKQGKLLSKLDKLGFYSMEVWGGGTFETSLKQLLEDPWEILEFIKKYVKKTPLQMVMRGRNVVGYHMYDDDVIELFIKTAVSKGINIIRVYDALNDIDNIKPVIKYAKKHGAKVQGTVCYTEDSVHTLEYFTKFAGELARARVDSIVIKDASGILTPKTVIKLIEEFKKVTKLPIQLHSHFTNGMVNVTYYEAIKAGIDVVDCSFGAVSISSAELAIENIIKTIDKKEINTSIDIPKLIEVSKELFKLCYTLKFQNPTIPLNDYSVFTHQIPKGGYSYLYKQLNDLDLTSKVTEVTEEICKVRRELGYPTLFMPIGQFVVVEALNNIITKKRYKIVSQELKDYISGFYGKIPGRINAQVKKKILGPSKKKKVPVLNKLNKKIDKSLVQKEEDYLTYSLFPEASLNFFKMRQLPEIDRLKSKANTSKEDIMILDNFMKESNVVEFFYENNNETFSIKRDLAENIEPVKSAATILKTKPKTRVESINKEVLAKNKDTTYEKIVSPMMGVFYSSPSPDKPHYVEVGSIVNKGDTVCIVEAMKLMNEIKAPFKCEIKEILVKNEEALEPEKAIFYIEKI